MDITLCMNSRDDELLAAVAKGDHDAFSEIYDRFAPHVFARANKQLVDGGQAEAVVRSVFLDLWQHAPRLDRSRADIATWLFDPPHLRRA
jgi:RNA polymerase sigma-70 factor (ECF subfamily)